MKGATIASSQEFRFRPAGFPGVYAENQARMSIFAAARQTSPPESFADLGKTACLIQALPTCSKDTGIFRAPFDCPKGVGGFNAKKKFLKASFVRRGRGGYLENAPLLYPPPQKGGGKGRTIHISSSPGGRRSGGGGSSSFAGGPQGHEELI